LTERRFPSWLIAVGWIVGVAGSVYCIRHYGFWHFLLKVILSP
jgi:hypothetical protein